LSAAHVNIIPWNIHASVRIAWCHVQKDNKPNADLPQILITFLFQSEPVLFVICVLATRHGMLLFSTDDEEDEVMQTRTRKKHKKLDFSGEGLTDLLFYLFYVQPYPLEPS